MREKKPIALIHVREREPIALIHVREKKLITLIHVREKDIYKGERSGGPHGVSREVEQTIYNSKVINQTNIIGFQTIN